LLPEGKAITETLLGTFGALRANASPEALELLHSIEAQL
jgi:hypothetical protein